MNEQRYAGIQHALSRVQESIDMLADYEKAIWPDQCQQAARAVADLHVALGEIVPADAREKDLFDSLREQTEEARLLVAALTPHCRSMELHHLRERLQLVRSLRQLVADVESQVSQ